MELVGLDKSVLILQNEDYWLNHCEKIFASGGRPSKFERLPQYLQTDRIRKYYETLEKRITARENRLNEMEKTLNH
jgi:hypothetical protein